MEENKNIFSEILGFLLKGVIYGVLPILLFIMITSRTAIIGGIQSFVILTGSMEPSIPVGSIVFTQRFSSYNIGNIIAFKNGDRTVTHRIVNLEKKNNLTYYQTRGDANNTADIDKVPQTNVLGGAFYSIPYLGRLVLFLKTVFGFLLFIVLPALIYIIYEIFNIKNEMAKEIEKKLLAKMQVKT